ncbi:hypothetical protein LZ32DRAFT_364909 [Colletotrichum eremochloae]|nr:hypothetical protein LZ32DRAFT_364909 [Colletotrichum eremochloae]
MICCTYAMPDYVIRPFSRLTPAAPASQKHRSTEALRRHVESGTDRLPHSSAWVQPLSFPPSYLYVASSSTHLLIIAVENDPLHLSILPPGWTTLMRQRAKSGQSTLSNRQQTKLSFLPTSDCPQMLVRTLSWLEVYYCVKVSSMMPLWWFFFPLNCVRIIVVPVPP